jgi:ubiquinone/menaquinone biosynthesis C-methylase UbiE
MCLSPKEVGVLARGLSASSAATAGFYRLREERGAEIPLPGKMGVSVMPFYTDRVLPHLVHRILRGGTFRELRQECLQGLSGTVLEVGFGSGLNLPWYPREVARLWFLEPSREARWIAREAIAAAPFPVEPLGDTAESIPLPDATVDAVVSTWTLCTIPDVDRALREMRRVLRPGGQLRFVEHGRSPEPRRLDRIDRFYVRGPKVGTYLYAGVALL